MTDNEIDCSKLSDSSPGSLSDSPLSSSPGSSPDCAPNSPKYDWPSEPFSGLRDDADKSDGADDAEDSDDDKPLAPAKISRPQKRAPRREAGMPMKRAPRREAGMPMKRNVRKWLQNSQNARAFVNARIRENPMECMQIVLEEDDLFDLFITDRKYFSNMNLVLSRTVIQHRVNPFPHFRYLIPT
jgi:hypothetical protein